MTQADARVIAYCDKMQHDARNTVLFDARNTAFFDIDDEATRTVDSDILLYGGRFMLGASSKLGPANSADMLVLLRSATLWLLWTEGKGYLPLDPTQRIVGKPTPGVR